MSEKNKERLSTPRPSREEEAGSPFSAGLLERGACGRGSAQDRERSRGWWSHGWWMGGEGTGLVQVWFGVVHSCPTPNHNFLLHPLIPTQGFQKRPPKGLYVSGGREGGGEVAGGGGRGTWCPGHVAHLPHQATPPHPPARKGISLEIAHSSGQEGGSLADREYWNWRGSGSGVKWGSAAHWAGLWEEGVQEVMALGAAMVLRS